jgi:hypothetical protein
MSVFRNLLSAAVLLATSAFGQSFGLESVIIMAAKPYDKVVAAIAARGGRVTHQFKYVDALAAEMPATAVPQIRASSGVISMAKDVIVESTPKQTGLESQLLGAAEARQFQAAAVTALSTADIEALSNGAALAGFNVDNTLLSLGPLFQAGKHGEGAIVAVLDSGIRSSFPVASSVIGGEDLAGDGLGYSNDANDPHGTFVASMIASQIPVFQHGPADHGAKHIRAGGRKALRCVAIVCSDGGNSTVR